jgi:deoxyguanosine kinase
MNKIFIEWIKTKKEKNILFEKILNQIIDKIIDNISNTQPYIIAIEGNIGVGKSTLMKFLSEKLNHPNCIFIYEPVEYWTNFDGFSALETWKQGGITIEELQWFIALTKLLSYIKSFKNENYDKIIFIERSFYSQLVFDDEEKDFYHKTDKNKNSYNLRKKTIEELEKNIKSEYIIYLKADPNILNKRIKNRNRNKEGNIPLNYLNDLNNKYDEVINLFSNDKIIKTYINTTEIN